MSDYFNSITGEVEGRLSTLTLYEDGMSFPDNNVEVIIPLALCQYFLAETSMVLRLHPAQIEFMISSLRTLRERQGR